MTTIESRMPPPPDEEEIPIHTRSYEVKSYRIDAETIRLRGFVTDTKPPGLYVRGDVEELEVHDMVVDLILKAPILEIASIEVVIDTHPHPMCPSIEASYQQLVGTSIARGFGRQLTNLFSGPSGCTHIGALLRAMAPVAIQAMHSMPAANPDAGGTWISDRDDPEQRRIAQAFIRDSCHVWAADGPMMKASEAGEPVEAPIWIRARLEKLDRVDELTAWE